MSHGRSLLVLLGALSAGAGLGGAAASCDEETPKSESQVAGAPDERAPSSRTETPAAASPSVPSVPTTELPPAETGTPAVLRIGRFDERDPAGPICGWPGCRFIFRFEGTSLSVRLAETPYMDGPSEWDVTVDGVLRPKLVPDPGAHEYALASDLPAGKHTVELFKRTEAQNGVTQMLGFDLHGGTLLPPPARKSRRVEIIGDSDVTGFGYEGTIYPDTKCPGDSWAAKYENYHGSWGFRLESKLDAEINAAAFSGKGFYFNIWRPDKETIGILYPRSNPVDYSSHWDFSKFAPDAVIVSIGGNDYNIGQPEDTGPAPLEGFTAKARELTEFVRQSYPNAEIFLMAYAVLTDDYPPGRGRRTNVEAGLKAVRDDRLAKGDTRVSFVAPPPSVPEELTGCDGHGGPEYHERIATFMATAMKAKLGWK